MSTVLDPAAPPAAAQGSAVRQAPVRVRPWWWVMLVSALIGVASGMTTVVEKIAILADPTTAAFCDISAEVGCTPVLLAPQSSVLGPPNAAIGIVLFGMFAAIGLAGVMGTRYPRSFRWCTLGLAAFFALFLTWYMAQVAFVIGSLCPLCAICAASCMALVLSSTRVLAADIPRGTSGAAGVVGTVRRSGLDVIIVAGWTVLIAGMLAVGILL